MNNKVRIEWTKTAKEGLKVLPKTVIRGLLEKADELYQCDPREANKPLTGPLQGYYRICYSRYRAIYLVKIKKFGNGTISEGFVVQFVVVGIRKENDKKDIYRLAKKLLDLGILPPIPSSEETA